MVALQGASLSPRVPLQVDQSGLGLPSRDYYLNKTENEKVSLPSLSRCARPGQLSFCGGLSFLRVDRQPLVGEGCPPSSCITVRHGRHKGIIYPFPEEDRGDSRHHL